MAQPPRSDADWEAFQRVRAALYRSATDEETPSSQLFPFLTETSLLLGGTDFANDHWIEYRGGALASFTQRAWGRLLGDWAIERGWRRSNDYAFFCYDLYTEIPDYECWVRSALEVIRRKCERQLDDRPWGSARDVSVRPPGLQRAAPVRCRAGRRSATAGANSRPKMRPMSKRRPLVRRAGGRRHAMRNLTTILTTILGVAALTASAHADTRTAAPSPGRYAEVNGLKMYYEIHGQGRPIVLLHGAFCTIDACFGPLVKQLSQSR
jgi:hypothetical protein